MPLPLLATMGIGAGLGALGNLFNKPAKTSTSLDPQTQQYLDFARSRAMAAARQGPSAQFSGALNNYGSMADLGMVGANAMAGDQSAIARMMNPYASTMDPIWDQMRQRSMGAVNDAATQGHAFGGARHGVAEGVALGDVGNAQATQRYGEFNSAMGRAGQLADLGMTANQNMSGMDWDARNQGLLMGAMGPYGTSTTTTGGGNILGGAVGGAMTGAGLAGWGNPSATSPAGAPASPWPGGMNPNWRPQMPASWPSFGH